MPWLNYHQLYYFWIVSREGTITRASHVLRVGQPTISVQIKNLEGQLGEKLFARSGRRLVHTETGAMVFRYATEIFALGNELRNAVKRGLPGGPLRLAVGVTDTVSKLVVCQLLEPALRLNQRIRLTCFEGLLDRLLADLATHQIDVILADTPLPPGSAVRAFSRLLVDSPVTFLAGAKLANRFRPGFPASLNGAPMLLPTPGTALRRELDQWFMRSHIVPSVVAEAQDAAMLKALGRVGTAVLPCPSAIERAVRQQYGLSSVGVAASVRERFYAISVARRVSHPAVVAILDAAGTSPT